MDPDMPTWEVEVLAAWAAIWLVVETALRIWAIGTVPKDRRPGSATAWLMLIFWLPFIGLLLFALIGSPWLRGRRERQQQAATALMAEKTSEFPLVPQGADADPHLESVLRMNRSLTGLPCVTGGVEGVHPDTAAAFAAMARAVDAARDHVHVEFYILAWDETTAPVMEALERAAGRGVEVRLLMDHLGSRAYPGFKQLQRRLTDGGVRWSLMMPIAPLQGHWRRPDLRNHRKLLVVDGERAFVGSHNLIEPAYGSEKNRRMGRAWTDLTVEVSGDVVTEVSAVFATDWYLETGEVLGPDRYFPDQPDLVPGGTAHAMQLVPSGPGFPTEPNLRMFTTLISQATSSVTITSPYFVPDEALLGAITSAVHRGVRVELFVGEKADQFLVGHAQRSYYGQLLEAGVLIHLYPPPTVLHSKYLTVDDRIGVLGSSNMDFRSYALNSEIMLLGFGGDLVAALHEVDESYRSVSRVLTSEEWAAQPALHRWLDNACRLTAALM
ncbi:phospholipase D-like domain-containing protein [Nocardioides bruguierae]|uniref:Phospholipase D-like domain-containing protein n=1 Tax=Nocardioides bruguierae TaxID=2945102 RepID=A0A9X2IGE0_9ACTN|nr:phospholipase D-like domain-containing protein [Nocardioides bruguierae]MCM0621474.1 phospholipase D-like domain-containing protein [Nocardioides bruguierae]